MTEHVQTTSQDIETQAPDLTCDELEQVSGGAGAQLASVTDLIIDPFYAHR